MTMIRISICTLALLSVVFQGCKTYDKSKYNGRDNTSNLAVYASSGQQIGVIRMAKNTRFCKPSDD